MTSNSSKVLVLGSLLTAALPFVAETAQAAKPHASHSAGRRGTGHLAHAVAGSHAGAHHRGRAVAELRHGHHGYKAARAERVASRGGLSCVPFARNETGMAVAGNAADWWDNASGIYARGSRPEPGSVLNFRANGRMPLGHVAVVTGVTDSRHVQIDHSNWSSRGRVSRGIEVIDVSPDNDWTAVRVALADGETYGSIYPTYGFIYDRPDRGLGLVAVAHAASPAPVLNPAPRDLRPAVIQAASHAVPYEEVAEAPSGHRRHHAAPHGSSARHAR